MKIGEFIKEQRVRKGYTQEELASRIDISVRTIQRIEKGEVDPRSYTLQAISDVLDIEFEKLISFGNKDIQPDKPKNDSLWIGLLHLSGLFILVIPPIIIWLLKKDEVDGIRRHAIDVINFQISMLIYLVPSGLLVLILIGLPLVIVLGIFSTVVILLNALKAINNQPYKYPLSIKILQP
nr:helix-turn-helix domain-containing protein [uncultured Draconibacterium sp.]